MLSQGPYDVVAWNASTLHMWNGAPDRCNEKTYPANMTEGTKDAVHWKKEVSREMAEQIIAVIEQSFPQNSPP